MTALVSRADVPTDAPARYAKQLISHLGRRIPFTEEPDGSWTTAVGDARGRIVVGDGVITIHAEARRPWPASSTHSAATSSASVHGPP